MTFAERRRASIEATVNPFVVKGAVIVAGRVADARAHAAQAISSALIATPDGRPTVTRANRNRSLAAAETRLAELVEVLAGPSTRSTLGLIRDAWEAGYRSSRSYWFAEMGADLTVDAPDPSRVELVRVRGMILAGSDARTRVLASAEPAFRRLKSLVIAQASPSRSVRDRSGSLKAWEVATVKAISLAVRNAIFTGAYRADVLAGRAVIRPDFLHDDPTIS